MQIKLFITISIFAISNTYTMDIKKHIPQLQEINSPDTLITFSKKTKTFEHWMLRKQNTAFGENRLFEYMDKTKGLTPIDTITLPGDRTFLCVAYISNLEKRYVSHTRYIMLGAFLIYDMRILRRNQIATLTNYYERNIPKAIRPPKPSPQNTITTSISTVEAKKPQERGSIIMQELFTLIETYGKPESLGIVTTQEDLALMQNQVFTACADLSGSAGKESKQAQKKSRNKLSHRFSRKLSQSVLRDYKKKDDPH